MRNTLIVLSSILIVLQAFTIRQEGTTENLKDIPWPFQVSDPIEWDVEAVYLSQRPARKVTFNTKIVKMY